MSVCDGQRLLEPHEPGGHAGKTPVSHDVSSLDIGWLDLGAATQGAGPTPSGRGDGAARAPWRRERLGRLFGVLDGGLAERVLEK